MKDFLHFIIQMLFKCQPNLLNKLRIFMWNLTFSSKTNTILNYFMRINIGCSLKIDWNALFWVRRTICALVGNQVELKSKWYSFRPKLKWHGTKDNTCWRQTTTIITNEHCKFDIISLAFQCNRLIGSKIKIEGIKMKNKNSR